MTITIETIERVWAMPNPCTFSISPIADLLGQYLERGWVIVDPFARDSKLGTITNDLNPSTEAQHHMPAAEFVAKLASDGILANAVLFDPPYSPRQVAECYQHAGLKATTRDTQNASLYADVRRGLHQILEPGGLAFSFGWNSSGFGKKYGYTRLHTLLVCHGGAHNDTICVVERKNEHQSSIF